MTYINDLNPLTPGNPDQVGEGAARIREVKAALIERLETLVTDVDLDPLVFRSGLTLDEALLTKFAKAVIKSSGLTIRDSGDANTMIGVSDSGVVLRNATFAGTAPGIYPLYARAEYPTTAGLSNNSLTSIGSVAVVAGTYLVWGSVSHNIYDTAAPPTLEMILSNSVNSQTRGAFQQTVGNVAHSGTLTASALMTLASSGNIVLSARIVANTQRVVYGANNDRDTSLTVMRVA